MAPASGRVGACQFDQLLFHIPLNLDLAWAEGLGPRSNSGLDALGDQALTDASHGLRAGASSRAKGCVGVFFSVQGGGQPKEARLGPLAGCGPASSNQSFQLGPFLQRQSDPILFHGRTPFLAWHIMAKASRNRIPCYPSIED
jgi:hypothetical protein